MSGDVEKVIVIYSDKIEVGLKLSTGALHVTESALWDVFQSAKDLRWEFCERLYHCISTYIYTFYRTVTAWCTLKLITKENEHLLC